MRSAKYRRGGGREGLRAFIAFPLLFLVVIAIYVHQALSFVPNPGHPWNQTECDSTMCVNSSSGRVGIGTSSPVGKLDIVGNANATGYLYGMAGLCISSDCRTAWSQVSAPSGWTLTGSYLYNSTVGVNVGIGTSSPVSLLSLYQPGQNTLLNASNGTVNAGLYIGTVQGGAGASIGTNSNHRFNIFTNGADRVTIDTSGNVGIGTATPTTGKLVVSGGNIDASNNKIINVSAPTASTDAATKGYVDALQTCTAPGLQCPQGWIAVPGTYNASFCVMKYDAKNLDGVVQSVAAGAPYISITQTAAITACSNIGAHLCTEQEAAVISRDIASVASNWQNGVVGSGCMYGGHMNNNPAGALAANDSDNYPYTGTNGCSATDTFTCPFTMSSTAGNCKEQRRTFTLSNGNVIWDWSGNVWEWLANTCTPGAGTGYWNGTGAWQEWTAAALSGYESHVIGPSNSSYNSNYGVGQYYGCTVGGNAFIRGGDWGSGADAGSFALNLYSAPSASYTALGFRCCK